MRLEHVFLTAHDISVRTQIRSRSCKLFVKQAAILLSLTRVATVREKYLENEIFSRSEKSENFVDGQGNLGRAWKVREKSGNLKVRVNGYGRRMSKNLFFSRGEGCTFSFDSLSPSFPSLRAILKERICSLGEQILSFKNNPQI